MAQKRMFDRAIIDTDKFLDLPISAKALYFLMGMEADDEGFVSPKKILRLHGGTDDDVKVLIAKNFLIPFDSGVVVITDWNKNNWLDSRRIRETEYQKEKGLLALTENNRYALSTCLASAQLEEYRGEESSIEEKRGEERRGEEKKDTYGEFQKVKLTKEEYTKLVDKLTEPIVQTLIDELDQYIASKGAKYKSHYATILAWARRKIQQYAADHKKIQSPKRHII